MRRCRHLSAVHQKPSNGAKVGGVKPNEAGNGIYVQKSNGTTGPNTKQANGRYFYLLAVDGRCGGSEMQGVLAASVKYIQYFGNKPDA